MCKIEYNMYRHIHMYMHITCNMLYRNPPLAMLFARRYVPARV